jgi:DNA polymerase III subunit delta
MRIKLEQLAVHLGQKQAPVYLIFGEELLLIEEAADVIRVHARSQGFAEREVLYAERGFDWGRFQQAVVGLSLFSSRRLLELRLPSGIPGEQGASVLQAYAENGNQNDTLLLIIGDKWERRIQGSKWFLALEPLGVVIQIPRLESSGLPRWIESRMHTRGLRATPEAIVTLAEREEGNLLACAQEIDKLALLYPTEIINAQIIEESVTDNARYDAFRLIESALAGDVARLPRILQGLRAEGMEAPVVVGALAWELRRLARVANACAQGIAVEQALKQHHIWGPRQTLCKQALRRHGAYRWRIFLHQLSEIDRMVKGVASGCSWEAIFQLCLAIAGVELFPWGNEIRGEGI